MNDWYHRCMVMLFQTLYRVFGNAGAEGPQKSKLVWKKMYYLVMCKQDVENGAGNVMFA